MNRWVWGMGAFVAWAAGCSIAVADSRDVPGSALRLHGETVTLKETIVVGPGETFDGDLGDGRWTRYRADPKRLGTGSQDEDQKPLFLLKPGATLTHVIIDTPSADGIHVEAARGRTTRIIEIQVRDVGEDAITVKKGEKNATVLIHRCSFLQAADKIIQINAESKVLVQACYAQNFVRFVRTCGTCPDVAYRVVLNDLRCRNGTTILKMSTSKARADMMNVVYTGVDRPVEIEGGAEVRQRNVVEMR